MITWHVNQSFYKSSKVQISVQGHNDVQLSLKVSRCKLHQRLENIQLSHFSHDQILSNFESTMVEGLRSRRLIPLTKAEKLAKAIRKVKAAGCSINKAAKEGGIDRRLLKR